MALALADAGADVILVGRDTGTLERTADEIRRAAARRRRPGRRGQRRRPSGPATGPRRARRPIDILVNNVGGRRVDAPTEDMPLEDWRRIIDLNLTRPSSARSGSAVRCYRAAAADHQHRLDLRPIANRGIRGRSYETGKAAVMFTKAVAADWAPHGVTVNAIAPGPFLTDANRRWISEKPEFSESLGPGPDGRSASRKIAPLAVYLASDASSYMTGA